jgi:hypothetical protein
MPVDDEPAAVSRLAPCLGLEPGDEMVPEFDRCRGFRPMLDDGLAGWGGKLIRRSRPEVSGPGPFRPPRPSFSDGT